MANQRDVSPGSFPRRLFRQSTGPVARLQFFVRERIERAKEMLRAPPMLVSWYFCGGVRRQNAAALCTGVSENLRIEPPKPEYRRQFFLCSMRRRPSFFFVLPLSKRAFSGGSNLSMPCGFFVMVFWF